ncbi:MAG TPA: HEAT repeat domain-containing protein, partial [Candidatus Eisenbacteria bacterium]|nr:HEAT repeat domain-containing protein [Candidatus Eisenbacteria bacterium]
MISDRIQDLDDENATLDTASEPSEHDSPELAGVRKLTVALAKAVKASQLYPIDNPMCRKFAEEFLARLGDVFQLTDTVRLSVGKTKLFYSGDVVLEQPGREESVPGRLFWAGVREITFHVGLTNDEATRLLGIFRATSTEEGAELSDVVTLLWDAKFDHVTYIAIDDILDLNDETDPIPAEFGHEFMNYVDLEMHDLEEDEVVERKANDMAEQIRKKFNDEDAALFGVTPEERAQLVAEIQDEESPRMLVDIVRMLGEAVLLEKNEAAFVDLVQVLSGSLVALIGEGRIAEAREVLQMLIEVRDASQDTTPGMRLALDQGIAAAYDRPRRELLARQLDGGRRGVLEALDAFVRTLPNEAIEALCDVLGNLETVPAKRRLTAALSLRANVDIRPFLPFLRDQRTELVSLVARILGDTKNDRAVEPLTGLLKHRDPNVRREALEALTKLASGRAMDAMFHALSDPDARIRIAAARNLGQIGRTAVPALLNLIQAEEFDGRPLPEKRAFYEALGTAGREEVLPLIKQ